MTKQRYRALVVASIATGLLGGVLDLIVPTLMPEPFHAAQAAYDEAMSMAIVAVSLSLGVPGLFMVLAATYGLFFFRRWAPPTAGLGTALTLVAVAIFGPSAHSGPAIALGYLSSYLWGVAVLLPFTPLCQAWFTGSSGSTARDA